MLQPPLKANLFARASIVILLMQPTCTASQKLEQSQMRILSQQSSNTELREEIQQYRNEIQKSMDWIDKKTKEIEKRFIPLRDRENSINSSIDRLRGNRRAFYGDHSASTSYLQKLLFLTTFAGFNLISNAPLFESCKKFPSISKMPSTKSPLVNILASYTASFFISEICAQIHSLCSKNAPPPPDFVIPRLLHAPYALVSPVNTLLRKKIPFLTYPDFLENDENQAERAIFNSTFLGIFGACMWPLINLALGKDALLRPACVSVLKTSAILLHKNSYSLFKKLPMNKFTEPLVALLFFPVITFSLQVAQGILEMAYSGILERDFDKTEQIMQKFSEDFPDFKAQNEALKELIKKMNDQMAVLNLTVQRNEDTISKALNTLQQDQEKDQEQKPT